MNYTVVWNRQPTETVDAAWERADAEKRDRLLSALGAVQGVLSANPFQAGESRDYPIERVAMSSPLTVYFKIDRATSMVRVYAVVVWRGR